MEWKTIKAARTEALRFLDRITDWEKTLTPGDRKQTHTDPDSIYNYGTKASGAIKRASLDLTRALANLRRP